MRQTDGSETAESLENWRLTAAVRSNAHPRPVAGDMIIFGLVLLAILALICEYISPKLAALLLNKGH